jgi:hypothetical protein
MGRAQEHLLGVLVLLDVPQQETHRPYVRAVAATLTGAGIPVTETDFLDDVWDDGDPIRCAQLYLDAAWTAALYGDRSVWLLWTEEWGWDLHVTRPGVQGDELTHPLCSELLPTPADVLAAVRTALAERPAPTGRPHPSYRVYSRYDDALETGLDTYAFGEGAPPAPALGDSPS